MALEYRETFCHYDLRIPSALIVTAEWLPWVGVLRRHDQEPALIEVFGWLADVIGGAEDFGGVGAEEDKPLSISGLGRTMGLG